MARPEATWMQTGWAGLGRATALGLMLFSVGAMAMPFDLGGGVSGSLKVSTSLGAAVRIEGRDPALIGKLNLPGQYGFCEDKMGGVNCSNVPGNAQYLALPGAPNVNRDNGDLNYSAGQLISAPLRVVPELTLKYRGWGINASAYAFYDFVNDNRADHHPNNSSNGGFQPATTPRPAIVNRDIGAAVRLKNAYLFGDIPAGDYDISVKIGQQLLGWGQAVTLLLNGISTINPPDANILTMPGAEAGEFLEPVPLVDLSSDLTDNVSVEAFYQFAWVKAQLPPDGGYFSTNDSLSDGATFAMADFGKYREDPNDLVGQEGRIQGNLALLTRAGRTLQRSPDRYPSDQGEYGFKFSYFADWLNNTSFGLYYHNLHSRLPIGSFIAAKAGCLSNATNQVDVVVACQGFANVPVVGKEPIPLDTASYFADYPSNIHLFGISFSANLGPVAWAGEIAYRPNQPLQIDSVDLAFAALQPMLPAHTISLAAVDIPGRDVAFPNYVSAYRNETIQPQQIVNGYERFKTIQYDTSFVVVRGKSGNPFGADQVTAILELGAYQVLNLPSLDQLQLAGPGTNFSHTAGIDGTGTPNADQASSKPEDRINPSYQADGFATRWSYGYRLVAKADYEMLIPGMTISPQLAFFHDVGGISPLPTGQFVSGRMQISPGVGVTVNNHLSTLVRYTLFTGGGDANLMRDRDYVQWSVTYDF